MTERKDATVQVPTATLGARSPTTEPVLLVCPFCKIGYAGADFAAHLPACVDSHPDHPAVREWRQQHPDWRP